MSSSGVISLTTFAGVPIATTLAGISFVTTEQAPITELSPIVTPGRIVTLEAIQTFFPMKTGQLHPYFCARSAGEIGWEAVIIVTFGAISVSSPI